jgi:amidohydrolase
MGLNLDIDTIKARIAKDIDSRRADLAGLSRKIHDNPETAMEEKNAAALLTGFLEENGFTVERGISRLPTAFKAAYGKGSPVIAYLAEYDALPKVGHACGHNLIAAASVAAALATKNVVDELGGTVAVFGTPGEEITGGKAIMAERGAFEGVDIAMICHPGGGNSVVMNALACQNLDIEFFGKAAHAAADPAAGINALAAMILSYNAIDALRQHIDEKARIHGIITDGGEVANVVPAHTAANFIVRAADDAYLDKLKDRVLNCFAGAAAATGAELKYCWADVRYAAMKNNLAMGRLFKKNFESLGRRIPIGDENKWSGSTDVGNVSRLLPAIQPMVGIAPDDVLIHSPEFRNIAATKGALDTLLDAAKAMAMTAADLLASPEALDKVQAEFKKS